MLDSDLKQQLQGYLGRITQPVELVAALDDSAAAGEMQALLADIASLSNLVTCRELRGSDIPAGKRTPSFQVTRPGADLGLEFAGDPDGPRIHLAGPGAAAGRRLPAQGRRRRDRADQGAQGRLQFRDLHFAVVPQLPRGRAVAQPHGGAEPERAHHHDRRRAVPAGSRKPPGHGRAVRVPEWRRVQPGPHQPRGDPGQGRHPRRRARGRTDQCQGPVRRAGRGRRPGGLVGRDLRGAQGHPHRRRRRPLRRPGDGHARHRELHLGQGDRGPEARRRARRARQALRRRHHEPAARAGPGARRRRRPVHASGSRAAPRSGAAR